ncbi:MAG: phosphotransferase [Chitinivibrionales bacterium]|nr:phosphotransferase [Chitinivibrionales bacterium]
MSSRTIVLTPAQEEFLEKNIPSFSFSLWDISEAANAGSDRRFVRVSHKDHSDQSYILIIWDSSERDWGRFVAIQRDLKSRLNCLPHILHHDASHGLILEEDFGNRTLNKVCQASLSENEMSALYKRVIGALVKWHGVRPGWSKTVASRSMDEAMFLWESDYFGTHCVTEFAGCDDLLDDRWEKERRECAWLASSFPRVCIHRDFQSENILLYHNRICFVDFQGARMGPAAYDLASLVYDPYVEFPGNGWFADEMLSYYRSYGRGKIDPSSFRICAVQRLMQALGAYANLSIHKKKPRYRHFMPIALKRLYHVLSADTDFPHLRTITESCLERIEVASTV